MLLHSSFNFSLKDIAVPRIVCIRDLGDPQAYFSVCNKWNSFQMKSWQERKFLQDIGIAEFIQKGSLDSFSAYKAIQREKILISFIRSFISTSLMFSCKWVLLQKGLVSLLRYPDPAWYWASRKDSWGRLVRERLTSCETGQEKMIKYQRAKVVSETWRFKPTSFKSV